MYGGNFKGGNLIGIFILGLALFCYPVLSMFNIKVLIVGIPLLYLYVFISWVVIIALAYWAARDSSKNKHSRPSSPILPPIP